MSRLGEECKIDTWKISRLLDASRREPRGKDIIIVPRYQRRLVWNHDKQRGLIDSIKKGYPFGSLLLYEDGEFHGKRRHDLIDGLQRTNAIRNYMDNPNQFFSAEDVDEDLAKLIVDELSVGGENALDKVFKSLADWVRDRRGFAETDGWGVNELARCLVEKVLDKSDDSDEYGPTLVSVITNNVLIRQLERFLENTRNAANISDAQLPVILYSGDSSKLPEIFELLNSKGVVLSRYEIYAARWLDYKTPIRREEIRSAIRRKYAALVDEGFTAAAYDDAEETKDAEDHEFTLYEFLFGFGQYLSENYRRLFRTVEADAPSSVGFNLVTGCLGMQLKEMDKLDERLRERNLDLNDLVDHILESVDLIDECLKPMLSINQRKNQPIYHAELQIVSMIASLFLAKYEPIALSEMRDWNRSQREILSKLPMYYLYDILRGHWRGSGDTKMHDDVSNQRYARRAPTRDNWIQVLDTWFEDTQLTLEHVRRYIREAAPEFLLLKYIYVKKFTVFENAQTFHVEHILPVNRIIQRFSSDGEGWQINCIANLALLQQELNLKKGELTFKEYWRNQLVQGNVDQETHDRNLAEDQKTLLCPVELLPADIKKLDKDGFERFLFDRFFHLRDEFVEIWQDSIPGS